ncbi:MAG: type II toxin-antitoxin system VapC family toxin [Desulfurococcales archaeon]|nr:type II toxin-antitoxin system VapC family toxin [Desulfurococcales archaeon]
MKFIDASVFLYAFLKPKRRISKDVLELKENAKKTLSRIDEGEEVATTVVHLSEVANILESYTSKTKSIEYIKTILGKPSIHVYDVDVASYGEAILKAEEYMIGVNDALALVYMEKLGLNEIYSFDSDFDKIKWIKRLTT